MPGRVLKNEGTKIVGCAWHPRFSTYDVLVHVVVGRTIVRSVFASEPLQFEEAPEGAVGHGFTVDVAAFGVDANALHRARLLIGETDEWFGVPPPEDDIDSEITVDEILNTSFPRSWIDGRIYFDAQLAGTSLETVVDLLYRDYLGRPAEPDGLAHYSGRIRDGGLSLEGFRRILVSSQEYAQHRWQPQDAPGAIFSQRIVMRAGREYRPEKEGKRASQITLSLRRLLDLDGLDFVLEAGKQLFDEPLDPETVWRQVAELRNRRSKLDLLRELHGSPAALARDIRFTEIVDEPRPVPVLEAPTAHRSDRRTGTVIVGKGQTREVATTIIPVTELLQADGAKFVTEAYRRLLDRAPSAAEAVFCATLIVDPAKKKDILNYLMREPEAINHNVRLRERPISRRKPGVDTATTMPSVGGVELVNGIGDTQPKSASNGLAAGATEGQTIAEDAPLEPLLSDRFSDADYRESEATNETDGAPAKSIVVLGDLLALQGETFVVEVYRQLFGYRPDAIVVLRHLAELADGRAPEDLVRTLVDDLAAQSRGVVLVADDAEANAAAQNAVGHDANSWTPMEAGLSLAESPKEPAMDTDEANAEASVVGPSLVDSHYRPLGNPHLLEGPTVGNGFYAAETNGTVWWRWTGPGRQLQIRLPVTRPGTYSVHIQCVRYSPFALDGLKVRCCGVEAPLEVIPNDHGATILCATWAPEAGFVGWMDVELETGPLEVSPDGRLLGLCIGSIQLEEL